MIHGHKVLWMENDLIKVAVLPEKGADIYEFIHKPSGVQFLMKTPEGLRPPGRQPPMDFLENYEGAWQELFPNHNEACQVDGAPIPFHGEVATRAWNYEVLGAGEEEMAIRFNVQLRCLPFRLERVMRIWRGSTSLELEGTVTNLSDKPQPFVWGQHITLGGDFLEEGCKLELPAKTICTPEVIFEAATARLQEAQCQPWPLATGRKMGERIDLSYIPGPQAHSHDDAYLTGLPQGTWSVSNLRLGLKFVVNWEATVFPWVVLWQPYGGADLPPLTGIYGVGIEPWVARYPLAQAIEHGQARWLQGREALSTKLNASVEVVEK